MRAPAFRSAGRGDVKRAGDDRVAGETGRHNLRLVHSVLDQGRPRSPAEGGFTLWTDAADHVAG
jgi:hypothetical protein